MTTEEQPKRKQSEASKEAGRRNTAAMLEATEHRGATVHGINAVIRSDGATIPHVTGAAAVVDDVNEALAQIEQDMGGDLSGAQREILRSCRTPMIVLRLAEAYLIKNDVVDRKGSPRGLLRIMAAYSNALRHNLCALGLQRVARQIESVSSFAQEYAAAKATGNTSDEREAADAQH